MLRAVHAALVPRAVASSVDELLAGATARTPLAAGDAKSGSVLERVVIDGRAASCSSTCTPTTTGRCAASATSAADPSRCGRRASSTRSPTASTTPWSGPRAGTDATGGARRCSCGTSATTLIPEGDEPVSLAQHRQLLDHLAGLAATFWEPAPARCRSCSRSRAARARSGRAGWRRRRHAGCPTPCPRSPERGWAQFVARAPADVVELVEGLRHDLDPLVVALRRTPLTFLHGDWKMGNLGVSGDRTRAHRLDLSGGRPGRPRPRPGTWP